MSTLQRRLSNARRMLKTRPNEEEHRAEGVTRSKAWKRAHKNKATGNVLPCTLEKYYGALQRKVGGVPIEIYSYTVIKSLISRTSIILTMRRTDGVHERMVQ